MGASFQWWGENKQTNKNKEKKTKTKKTWM